VVGWGCRFEFLIVLMRNGLNLKRCKRRVDAFLRRVETFIELPTRFMSVRFGCMVETGLIGIDPGKLA
jgi:hypothetical protein